MDSSRSRKIAYVTLLTLLSYGSASAGLRQIPPVTLQPAAATGGERLYIVQFDKPPALALPANQPAAGQTATAGRPRFNARAGTVIRYVESLRQQQNELLQSVNAAHQQIYSYSYTFNGVAVKLSPQQASKLRLRKGVNKVWEDQQRAVADNDVPEFLGLLDSNGGLRSDLGLRGDDIIIGVIDSGIAPDHPSFDDHAPASVKRKPSLCRSEWAEQSLLGLFLCRKYKDFDDGDPLFDAAPAGWQGGCETGEGFPADACNNKLIGARYYDAGFRAGSDLDVNEFLSPADADGHGTHVASVAAGNEINASIYGRDAGKISGIAPRARIAVYKACWLAPGGKRAACSIADLQAAIEDAVADGVDIINYAIGDLDYSLNDPDDLALLAAADAGILSVTPSGNDGPDAFSILSPAATPWVISVGATTRPGERISEAFRVTVPAGVAGDYEAKEASFTPRLADRGPISAPLVLADDGEIMTPEGEAGTIFDACSELINTAAIHGNIALVQRGGCNFDLKLRYAQDAGAVAMVVFNNDLVLEVMAGSSSFANIPAIMIGQGDGQLLRDRLTTGDTVEVTLDKSIFIDISDTGNVMAGFSGRGPSLADANFLKPDVVAPGVDILGGQSPNVANGFRGENFQYLTGTSQSVPHVAGLAALIRQDHPDWSPAEIKSAMMTSARQDIVKEDRSTAADPFDMGAGHIVPNRSVNPGLLYDITSDEYDSYLCTVGLERVTNQQCQALIDSGLDLDAHHLNLPSVAITELVASESVTRTVRNPGPATQFNLQLEVPLGIGVTVTPSVLNLGANATAEYSIEFTSDGTRLGQWGFGSLSWVNEQQTVYTPFAVQAVELAFTDEIWTVGAPGSVVADVRFGYDGNYGAQPVGARLPCVFPADIPDANTCNPLGAASVADDPLNSYEFLAEPLPWVERFTFEVEPATADNYTAVLRIALFDQLTDGLDDLDLYLYFCADADQDSNCDGDVEFVATSQNDQTSEELITELDPLAGIYFLDVHGYETDPFIGEDGADFSLYVWALDINDDAGNLLVSGEPANAIAGAESALTLSWGELADGLWLGGINHTGGAGQSLGVTLVEIDNTGFEEAAGE